MTEQQVLGVQVASEERIAFDHEHGRLYDALERTAQLAELAGHDGMAETLRILRRKVAKSIERGWCEDEHR